VKPKKPAKAKKRAPAAKPKPAPPEPAALKPRPPQTRTVNKRAAFLQAYAVCASVRDAARAARISRRQHYEWMRDPEYARRFQEMKAQASQALEDEAVERATRGVYEPNVFQGKFIYPQYEHITPAVLGPRGGIVEPERREWRDVPDARPLGVWRKSDTLLIHLLRGFLPEKYNMRGAFEVSGPGGGPIEIVERLNAARRRAAERAAALRNKISQ
jgi:hypothetical protein